MIIYSCDFCGCSLSKFKIHKIYLHTDYLLNYDLCRSCYKQFSEDLLNFVKTFKTYKKNFN